MKTRLLPLFALATLIGQATALTVTGTVEGAKTPDLRMSAFMVSPLGQALQEVASVPVTDNKFRLEVPSLDPHEKTQSVLVAEGISWPGVIEPILVNAESKVAELKFFSYVDLNKNGRRDDNEALTELSPNGGRAA